MDSEHRFVRPSKEQKATPASYGRALRGSSDEFSEKSHDEASLNSIIKTADSTREDLLLVQ